MLNFDNTEIAFQALSDFDLRKAHILFKTFGNRLLMETGPRLLTLALKFRLPVSPLIKATVFEQFCGGETIEECARTMASLAKSGVGSILDYSVEGMQAEEDFDRTRDEILRTIAFAKNNPHVPFSVFKMTGVARFALLAKLAGGEALSKREKEEFERVRERVYLLCQTAASSGVRIMIDAEETWIQDPIDDLAKHMMRAFNQDRVVVYNTVQMYRTDRMEFMRRGVAEALRAGYGVGLKLVRGAYMEKERDRAQEKGYASPIQPSKAATDAAFDSALNFVMDHIDQMALCSGSHNEKSAYVLARLIDEKGLSSQDSRVYFSQLLGMSNHITFNLAHQGFNVAKYMPYGAVRYVMPYLMRRAEENSSVKGQAGRELQLIERELKRRTPASKV